MEKRKKLVASSRVKRGVVGIMEELVGIEGLDDRYLVMGDRELGELPAFDGEGNVVFYDIGGGYLLGKLGLERYVRVMRKKIKNR
jgi:hypothetical protein